MPISPINKSPLAGIQEILEVSIGCTANIRVKRKDKDLFRCSKFNKIYNEITVPICINKLDK